MSRRPDIRKIDDISNESDRYVRLKGTAKVANINERFDDTTHNDNPYDDAIQYLGKKIEDIIDESNLQNAASASYDSDIQILKSASGSSLETRITRFLLLGFGGKCIVVSNI